MLVFLIIEAELEARAVSWFHLPQACFFRPSMGNKRILLTNDDGIGTAGLRALESALLPLGDVTVVAPDSERSGSSQALTLHQPLRVKTLDDRHFAVGGTPAVLKLLPERSELLLNTAYW